VPLLVDHFVERIPAELGRPVEGVSRDALARLFDYPFPGNVRELRNKIRKYGLREPANG
jgi:DNA-binding NtrC family response regulator